MSDATIVSIAVALCSALPPTIAALAALRQSKHAAVKTDENTALTENLVKKTDEIHELTNSQMTAVKADLDAARQQIKDMQALLTSFAPRINGWPNPRKE